MGLVQRPSGGLWWFFLTSLLWIQISVSQKSRCIAPKLRPNFKHTNLTIVKGHDSVKLQCQIDTVSRGTQYLWFKNGKPIYLENNTHMRVKKMRYLKIKRAGLKDNGKYTCVSRNACGTLNLTIQLIVEFPSKFPPINGTKRGVPPKIVVNSQRRERTLIAVPVGNSIKMDCSADGYPRPTVKWYKNGRLYTHSVDGPVYLSPYQYVLSLRNVVPGNSGVYTCNVSNHYGWFNHTYKVDVRERVRAKPVLQKMENVTAVVGTNATLICKAMSDSMPHFQWIRWFLPIFNTTTNITTQPYEVVKQTPSDDSRHIIVSKRNGKFTFHGVKLTLVNVTKSEQGKYTCLVGNAVGYNIEHVYLKVVTPEEIKVLKANTQPPTKTTEIPVTASARGPTTASDSPDVKNQSKVNENQISASMLIAVSVVAFFILCIFLICCYVFAMKRKTKQDKFTIHYNPNIDQTPTNRNMSFSASASSYGSAVPLLRKRSTRLDSNLSQVSEYELALDEEWELDRSLITLVDTLGEGAFGRVMKADAIGLKNMPYSSYVAVKMLKEDATEHELADLISEMEVMKTIGQHKNIINLIGACTQDGPLFVVVEYAKFGNLRQFLRDRRPVPDYMEVSSEPREKLHLSDLVSFAYQVSRGMEYLESKKCIHRDLAARNVLVAEDHVIKIADFGLARDVHNIDYYRKTTDGRLPVKWMALEALFDRVYTAQSDVWAFGVLLWEIVTFGGSPYPGIPLEKLFELLKSGYRMEKPVNCDDNMYAIMLECWRDDPFQRPTFTQLVKEMDAMLSSLSDKIYLSLQNASSSDPIAPPQTPTSSQSSPTPRESLSSSVFESNENINIWTPAPCEHHRNNAGYLHSARNDSVSTKDKPEGLTKNPDGFTTDKDQRDSGVGFENANTNSNMNEAKKTFFREPLVSEI
ncbi:Fibroblast growth factor receptor 3 [Exaiptasia diaphana]|nr:Fibroblast growth factor receptor 3 [Exaiptasia diaphana]